MGVQSIRVGVGSAKVNEQTTVCLVAPPTPRHKNTKEEDN